MDQLPVARLAGRASPKLAVVLIGFVPYHRLVLPGSARGEDDAARSARKRNTDRRNQPVEPRRSLGHNCDDVAKLHFEVSLCTLD